MGTVVFYSDDFCHIRSAIWSLWTITIRVSGLDQKNHRHKNKKLVWGLLVLVAVMGGLALFSAPLYKRFCEITGFAGTPIRSNSLAATKTESSSDNKTGATQTVPASAESRRITVNFNVLVNPGLNWKVTPPATITNLPVGKSVEASFIAENLDTKSVTGIAAFNVTPVKAAPFVSKFACFCFDRQTLAAGAKVPMVVSFLIDPKMVLDSTVNDINEITLSYSFFKDANATQTQRVFVQPYSLKKAE